jgi:MFS family permease
MVGVMVMTPVHMGHGGASLQVVGIVISAHVAGMYAASPVFGWLADRTGRVPAIAVGLGLLLASLLTGAFGSAGDHTRLGVALAMLGLGWSCCLVAGSTLLSESVPETVRTSAQGSSDLVMGIAGASAGALAGPVLGLAGYPALTLGASALLVPVVILAVLLARTRIPAGRTAA